MNWIVTLCALLGLAACAGDETISGYVDPAATYVLQTINGADVTVASSISFPKQGKAQGAGPCNIWSAQQSAPYPWFRLGFMRSTRRACPDLDHENLIFNALRAMTLAEVSGDVLILSNTDGGEMVFRRQP